MDYLVIDYFAALPKTYSKKESSGHRRPFLGVRFHLVNPDAAGTKEISISLK